MPNPRTKKHIIRNITITLIAAPLIIFAAAFFIIPSMVASSFEKTLIASGITPQSITKPQVKWGAIRYRDLAIGQGDENTIDAVTLKFGAMTLFNKKFDTLKINGLYVSGDIDINGKPSIKGLNALPSLHAIAKRNIDQIIVKNANFSILSAHLGGLRGVINISGSRKDTATIWNGTIDSRQDQLELVAKFNAQTNDSGHWIADIDIENAKLERGFGKFTRVNGGATYTGHNNNWESLKAELSAGGFTAYSTSWQNAAITIDAAPRLTKTYINAKSSGTEGVELNIDTILSLKSINWNARIHADTGREMIGYFKSHNMLPLPDKDLKEIPPLKNLELQLKPTQNGLIFKINNEKQEIDIKGKIDKKDSENLSVLFTTSKKFTNSFSGAKCTMNQTKNRQLCRAKIIYKDGKYTLQNE